ncbi:hypothetical protein ACFW1A_14755 [Kitasatospora sp. NPDC058965]|uniref:hypothetical protein n=1 Tax=Kitasatospora sp. NPDC058965 TaxID=3346682 RepID=UPI0036805180
MAAATARGLWRTRAAMAPSWAAVGLYVSTAALGAALPLAWAPLGTLAVLVPAGWAVALRRPALAHQRKRLRKARPLVAAGCGVLAWMAGVCAFGPASAPLAVAWLVGTATGQAMWLHRRHQHRQLAAVPLTQPAAPEDAVPAASSALPVQD